MIKCQLKNILVWLIVLIVSGSIFLSSATSVKAESAFLYISPSSGSFLVGSVFTVSIFVDTEGNEINSILAELKFPPQNLQVTSPTAGTSFISEWLSPPSYANETGIISFRGGIPGGITTSAGLISAVTFRAVSSGVAKIEFREGSKVLLNDGKGTNILSNMQGGEYQILIPPPEGPQVFSPTHPNPNTWYSDSGPSFSWEEEAGVTDYSWSFDQNPSKRPDTISEGIQTQVSFSEVDDGIWYFHLRQKKQGVWGKTSDVQVKVDANPPREFSPKVEAYTRLVGYQSMVYFETTDDFSGISHYEVSIIDLDAEEPFHSFSTEAVSPYKVPFQKAGKYNVIIKAVDGAGNVREAEARFRLITPLITHLEGQGLEFRGILFSWWVVWFLVLLLPILLIGAWWYFFQKRRKR